MNPVHRRPLLTGAVMLFASVVFTVVVAIGLYVRDTNRNSQIERREVREHRIANERSHNILCRNQEAIAEYLGIADNQLECPEPRHFDESGLELP